MICRINDFYKESPQLIRRANEKRVSPAELCMQEFKENWSRDISQYLNVLRLCEDLLYDLEIASYLYTEPDRPDMERNDSKKDLCRVEAVKEKKRKSA